MAMPPLSGNLYEDFPGDMLFFQGRLGKGKNGKVGQDRDLEG
jgi:hypothetical protein